MDKNKVIDLLENTSRVYISEEDFIDTKNGILNKGYVERKKQKVLMDGLSYLADELVKVNQDYPIEDISRISLESDIVIMTGAEHAEILKELYKNE